MERIDDLQIKDLRLIQDTDGFCFGVDAVLLSAFAKPAPQSHVLDLCCGNGIVPLLLWAKYDLASIDGLELLPASADLARRSVALNGLEDTVTITCGDLKEGPSIYKKQFDLITCNPPYMNKNGGLVNPDDALAAARHELFCTLEDVVACAAKLLRFRGRLCMVHRMDRLVDVLATMRAYRLEPKRICFVHPRPQKPSNLFLVEGVLGGKPLLKTEPPIYVYDEQGRFSAQIDKIYNRDKGTKAL